MKVSTQEILDIVASTTHLRRQLKEDTIFTEAGLDSLDLYSILMGIEEKFRIKIPDSEVSNLTTVQAIVTFLDKNIE